jgi:branched-subunit amino acid aminotransferase/4-amino-4-deoxychorismate lyase
MDLGLLRGIALFETMRTRRSPSLAETAPQPHAFQAHMARLRAGAAHYQLGLPDAWQDGQNVRAIINAGLTRCAFAVDVGARINVIATPGDLTSGMFGSNAPRGIILLSPLQLPAEELLNTGIAAITHPALRVDPDFKTTCYLMGRPALLAAQAAGAQEALYCDADGLISEGVISNCGLVRNGGIVLPDAAALAGTTLTDIRHLADARGITITQSPLTAADFQQADEAFVCSSVRGILPVVTLDGRAIGKGHVGPLIKELALAHRDLPASP